ncbi:glycosyltransferase family 4 protein [Candidatus Collierbacteria bacterium]|nr:glycosyltransferase family 4 protein [Candidatus Collierbacteria bacterium]
MRIGVDARFFGINHTGIGRYVENLIGNLAKIDKKNTYIIFGHDAIKTQLSKYPNFKFVKLSTKPYSLAEQVINPLVFYRHQLDLLHVPHFNAPLLYLKKHLLTIHDLIKHYSTGPRTSTLPWYQYFFKHWLYLLVVRVNVAKAVHIITPSFYWKKQLVKLFHLNPAKITVTYEAATSRFGGKEHPDPAILDRFAITKPFVIYTGNLYPHKNIPFLISALEHFNHAHQHQLQLAIVSSRNHFSDQLPKSSSVKLLGKVTDAELTNLYSQALALVQPSKIEGFGLLGLEAMSAGLPVISSNATCLPEIYADAALYFDPNDEDQLIKQLEKLLADQELKKELIDKGFTRVKQFSWYKMAKQTKTIYQLISND